MAISRASNSTFSNGNIRYRSVLDGIPAKTTVTTEALIVAGGGSGCGFNVGGGAGGGGGGGLLYYGPESPKTPNGVALELVPGTQYTITVGNGAIVNNTHGNKGENSSISGAGFSTLTAIGGGGGMTRSLDRAKCDGGSGGGGPEFPDATVYGFGTSGQGWRGGRGATNTGGGGGGGAGGQGGNADSLGGRGGHGGSGLGYTITGSLVYYAGGGGGSQNSGPGGKGGIGGGGDGGSGSGGTAWSGTTNGQSNRGGGGGGSYTSVQPGNGGSGIVILSSERAAVSTTGSPVTSINNGSYVYIFNNSGSITF
jgi:hypothetical protein